MLTIFCSPKPFTGEADWNQRNALRSWKAINPDVEIFIFGNVHGAQDAAVEVDAILVPQVECSPTGAPSFNFMVQYANEHGRFDFQLYVNCDILLDHSILKAFQKAAERFEKFLLVGERLDLSEGVTIDIRQSNLIDRIVKLAGNGQIVPHGPTGADYFGFTRSLWNELPPVFMGRALCDNALIHYCLKRKIPVIDATLAVLNIHQYHGYSHVKGGRQEVFIGKDREDMAAAHGLHYSLPTVADANWRFLKKDYIDLNRDRGRLIRYAELVARYNWKSEKIALFLRAIQYLGGKKGVQSQKLIISEILSSWQN